MAGIDGKQVGSSDELWNTLKAAKVGEVAAFALSDGRVLRVVPVERTTDAVRQYCTFVGSVRTVVKVFIARDMRDTEELELSLRGPVTLAEIRRQAKGMGPVRVILVDACNSKPSIITDDPPDSLIVSDGSVLLFGYDKSRLFRVPQNREGDPDPKDSDGGP